MDINNIKNDCRNCGHAKDRYQGACFCDWFACIRDRPKKYCFAWIDEETKETEEKGEEKE